MVAVGFGFYLGLCGLFFSFTADDAFIIARYAENLVRGEGLVFNPGERINALTCPLMALVQAGIYALCGATLVGTKVLSIGLVAAAHLACLWRLRGRSESVCLYGVLAVASPFVAFWAIGGMETPLLAALVTAAALLYLRIEDRGIGRWPAAALSVLWGLCFLTRYDAALFCAPAAVVLLVRHPRKAGWLIAPALVVAGGWLVFAQAYYHDVFPTSFYVKSPVWRSYEVKRTAGYLVQFLICSGWGLLGLAILARVSAGGAAAREAISRHAKRYSGLYLGLVCFAFYATMNATKHMMFSYRMLIPFVPATGVVMLELFALAHTSGGRRPVHRVWLAAACLGMLAVQGFFAWQIDRVSINPGYVGEYLRWGRRNYVQGFSQALRDAADAIRRHWRRQPAHGARPPRISTFAAGITPYYLPEAYVYEQLVSYRHGGAPDWDRVFEAVDYAVTYAPRDATLKEIGAIHPETEWTLVARYPFWFDGRWVDLCVLHNPNPRPYPLPRFVDG